MSQKKNILQKLQWIIILVVVVLAGVVFYNYMFSSSTSTPLRYVMGTVEKGMLISSVSGDGQVIVANQVDIKPKVSGVISALNIQEGDKISAGAKVGQIDLTDVLKSIRDAQHSVDSARLALQKLQEPPDDLSIAQATNSYNQALRDLDKIREPAAALDVLQARNAVSQAERDLQQLKDNNNQQATNTDQTLQSAFDDAYNAVSNVFLDIATATTDIQAVNSGNVDPTNHIESYRSILGSGSSLINNFLTNYDTTFALYHLVLESFQNTSRTSDRTKLFQLLNDTLNLSQAISQSLEDSRNMLDAVRNEDYEDSDIASIVDDLTPKIAKDIGSFNKDLTTLQSAKEKIDTSNQSVPTNTQKMQDAIKSAQDKLQEKQQLLDKLLAGSSAADIATAQEKAHEKKLAVDKLNAGPDAIDIQNQELVIQEKETALQDTKDRIDDYAITAPFDGVIQKLNSTIVDNVSPSTVIASLVTEQLFAQISLNEVDIAQVKEGNKVTLTFDAIDGLNVTGKVLQVDTIGTTTQGVVTYNAKIALDTQDAKIKSGMSVSAVIITKIKQDVLLVPSTAVKSQGDSYYVEMIDNPTPVTSTTGNTNTVTSDASPKRRSVTIGDANDTQTEILDGVQVGEQIVTQTINSTTVRTQTSSSSTLRIPGLTGGGPPGGG